MKRLIILFIVLLLVVGCAKKSEITPKANLTVKKNISSEKPKVNLTKPVNVTKKINATAPKKNATKNITKPVTNTTIAKVIETKPEIYRSCKYSLVIYGGCRWKDNNKTSFDLSIDSGSPKAIESTWFVIYGKNSTKYIKNTNRILSKSSRLYNVDYKALIAELGAVNKFEVLPTETIEGREVACYNMRTSFVPTSNCKMPAIHYD